MSSEQRRRAITPRADALKRFPWSMAAFALLFSALFWGIGGVFVYGLARQGMTASWTPVPAEVLSSEVKSRSGGKGGRTYYPAVVFAFELNGVRHTSETVTLGGRFSASRRDYAETVVRNNPPGSKRVAYVNPSDATEAVLYRGIGPREWRMMGFVSIFLVVPLVPWMFVAARVVQQGAGFVATVRVFEPAEGVTVIRNLGIWPSGWGVIGFFVGMLITVMLAVSVLGDSVVRAGVLIGCVGSVVLGLAAWLAGRAWVRRGRSDHVIDRGAGVLIVARGAKRQARSVPLSEIEGTVIKQDSGHATNRKNHFRVHAKARGLKKSLPLCDVRLRSDAEVFEAWIRGRLGLNGPPCGESAEIPRES